MATHTVETMDEALRGARWSYTRLSRQWFGAALLADLQSKDPRLTDELWLAARRDGECGAIGEFAVRWRRLYAGEKPAPRLEVFDDGWALLAHRTDFLEALAGLHAGRPSPEKVCEVLDSLGFEDATQTVPPQKMAGAV